MLSEVPASIKVFSVGTSLAWYYPAYGSSFLAILNHFYPSSLPRLAFQAFLGISELSNIFSIHSFLLKEATAFSVAYS